MPAPSAESFRLSRVVRIFVPLDPAAIPAATAAPRSNSFAGWPAPDGLSLPFTCTVECRGRPEPRTGYLVGIDRIDASAREAVLAEVPAAIAAPAAPPTSLLSRMARRTADALAREGAALVRFAWHLSPHRTIAMETDASDARIHLEQQFDFAAAHRLRRAECDDAENARLFGKCRALHGHNYRLEVSASRPLDAEEPGHAALAAVVDAAVLRDLDHADLNALPDFADRLPSVEHIAAAIHRRLRTPLSDAGLRLERVRVWETEKTSCTYPG